VNPNRSTPATIADSTTTSAPASRACEKPCRRRGVTTTGPTIWPTEYPLVSNATAPGNPSRRPAAKAIVLTPMNVPPNRIAPTTAATGPEPMRATRFRRPVAAARPPAESDATTARTATPTARPTGRRPGTAAEPTGRILLDGRDQERARDDVSDSLEGVAHEQHREPPVRVARRWRSGWRGAGTGIRSPTHRPRAGAEYCGHRRCCPPRTLPARFEGHRQDQRTGQRDAEPDTAEAPTR
jgi:hypothetical protein